LPESAFESKAVGEKNTDIESQICNPLSLEAECDHAPDDPRCGTTL
jgi:hypothetical protein